MMTLTDIEEYQEKLLKKVQTLFENKNRTQKEMDDLYDEIRKFEKEKSSLVYRNLMDAKDENE